MRLLQSAGFTLFYEHLATNERAGPPCCHDLRVSFDESGLLMESYHVMYDMINGCLLVRMIPTLEFCSTFLLYGLHSEVFWVWGKSLEFDLKECWRY